MGQKESSLISRQTNQQFQHEIEQQYYLYKSNYDDKRLNQIEIYEHKHNQDEYVALRVHNCTSEQQYKQMLAYFTRISQLLHKNIVDLLFVQGSKEQLCGGLRKLKLYYQYYGLDMKTELEQRTKQDQQLSETEIWYILDSLVEALHYLNQHQVEVKYLRIDHIMLSNDGMIKLMIQQKQKGLNRLFGVDDSYMSPEQIQQFNYSIEVSNDIGYSLAIVVLYCCTLENPVGSIYNVDQENQVSIDYDYLQQMLTNIKQKYSHQFLGNLLEKMLLKDKCSRFDIQMINSILIPYRNQIQKMENFTQYLNEKEKGSYEIVHTKSKCQSENKYVSEFQHIFGSQPKQKQTNDNKKISHFKFGTKQGQFYDQNLKVDHNIEFKNISMVNSYQSDNYSQLIDKKYIHKYQDIFQNNFIDQKQQEFSNNNIEFSKDKFQNDLEQILRNNFVKNNDNLRAAQLSKSITQQPSNQVIYQGNNTNSHFQSQQSNMNQSIPNSKLIFNSFRQPHIKQSQSLQKPNLNNQISISNVHK